MLLDDVIVRAVSDPRFVARFWSHIERGADGECWNWTGGTKSSGYGTINVGVYDDPKAARRTATVSRVAWIVAHGKPDSGLCVCHRCDNRRCANPRCLFLGTQAKNTADKIAKGRERHAQGAAHGSAKLNDVAVSVMRVLSARGISARRIARAYGVSDTTVRYAISGRCWRFVS